METPLNEKQKAQFNNMLNALKEISKFQSPEKLRKNSTKDFGLDYEEALEYAYENVLETAKTVSKTIKHI